MSEIKTILDSFPLKLCESSLLPAPWDRRIRVIKKTIRLIETLHKSDRHCFVRYEGFSYLGVCDEFFTELFRNRGCNLDIDFGREECGTMG